MIEALTQRIGVRPNVSEDSHFMGALGASLFALDHILGSRIPAARQAQP
jgi:activator of 2-hydroxyglutaryl-CoA dehydratase